jgi:hypothetical protein
MRNNFEITIEGRRESDVCENAMLGLGRLLPERFFVLAKNYQQYQDFMRVIHRQEREGLYIGRPEVLFGTRDPVIVQIGHYYEHPEFVEFSKLLETRGRLTNVTVTDWR